MIFRKTKRKTKVVMKNQVREQVK